MTKDEAIDELRAIASDPEAAHSEAEDIVLKFLRDMGYGEVADEFERVRDEIGFWYA